MNKVKVWLCIVGIHLRYLARRMFCRHFYMKVREVYGDEITHRNGVRSDWTCVMCDKHATSKTLYDPPGRDKC